MTTTGEPGGERRRLIVEAPAPAERLDAYIARRLPELSRSRVAQLLEAGHVRLNGRVPRKSERPAAGDTIEVELPAPEPTGLEPEPIPLDIAYEDADLLVVDKPAGLVVHPAPGHRQGTLVNALLHHVSDLSGVGGRLRPGIVHRLDKDTSGLLIVAKNDAAHRRLSAALKRREIRRLYLTAAWGHLASDAETVDAPIGRSPTDRKRMAVVEGGRPAVTHLRRVERWVAADLLRAELETGRTHQIRVHLAWIGHPVVGDPAYGGGAERGISGPGRAWARQFAKRVPRQFLHAAELRLRHPRTGRELHFTSPLPPELAAAVEWARSTSGSH
ncbi:MAG TPA: RluA family pseudouridine synthase [Longimicrobiales bacterium]